MSRSFDPAPGDWSDAEAYVPVRGSGDAVQPLRIVTRDVDVAPVQPLEIRAVEADHDHAALNDKQPPGIQPEVVVRDYTAILSGETWWGPDVTGKPVFLTYSFETTPAGYLGAEGGFSAAFLNSFEAFTDSEKTMARNALNQWAAATGIVFLEAPAGQGDMRFGKYDFTYSEDSQDARAFAFYPVVDIGPAYAGESQIGGDVFVDSKTSATNIDTNVFVMLHEIGHALGFKHSFSGDPTLATDLDTTTTTVMSYTGHDVSYLGLMDRQAGAHVYGPNSADGTHVASWSWDAAAYRLTQTGGAAADTIRGVATADLIRAGDGADIVFSSDGNDDVAGEAGDDALFGGLGHDALNGGDGNDWLDGQEDSDTISGGAGHDRILGDAGNDRLSGDAGNDTIAGGDNIDTGNGGAGNDLVFGNAGIDTLNGDEGDDLIVGGADGDLISGGAGNDRLVGDAPAVTVGFGSGTATLAQTSAHTSIGAAYSVANNFSLAFASNIEQSTVNPHTTVQARGNGLAHYYSLDLTAGASIVIDIDNGTNVDTFVRILNASGLEVATNDDDPTTAFHDTDSYLAYTAFSSGTVYVVVGTYGDEDRLPVGSSYNLHISIQTDAGGFDSLIGGAGDDTMTGGLYQDRFFFEERLSGVDVITDFDAADNVFFNAAAFGPDFATLQPFLRQDGADVVLELGYGGVAESVRFQNVTIAALTANRFGFQSTTNAQTIAGTALYDVLFGSNGNDAIDGGAGPDALSGAAGNDTLIGGLGTDTLRGGLGDDTYRGFAGDIVIEAAGQGFDTIESAATLSLESFTAIEAIVLTGAAAASARGNALDNLLQGNGAANLLEGLLGNDTLDGGAGIDTMIGGVGNDTYVVTAGDQIVELASQGFDRVVSAATFTLADHFEALQLSGASAADGVGNAADNMLTGNSGANRLTGLAGADTLEGGAGTDTLVGGAGNDVYVNPLGDTIIELAAQGFDRVISETSFSLATLSYVERLELSGAVPGFLRGNNFANQLVGNAGSNTMSGFDGDDVLFGLGGRDTIIGGMGRDQIAPGLERDTIKWDAVAESTGAGRDFISEFVFSVGSAAYESLDFHIVPTALRATITAGALNQASFDADLQAAVNAANLGAGQAVLFDPNGGDLNVTGHLYLIVDANGQAGYQAGQDYVVQFTSTYGTLTLANFI